MGFALVIVVAGAQAADYIPSGQPIPQGIRWVNSTATGADTSAWARVGTTTSKFPVHVPSSTLGRLAGAALRRGLPAVGWGLALRDLVNGAGWAIDELQQQVVTQPATEAEPLGESVWCVGKAAWGGQADGRVYCANTAQALTNYIISNGDPNLGFRTGQSFTGSTYCPNPNFCIAVTQPLGGGQEGVAFLRTGLSPDAINTQTGSDATYATDTQLGDLLKASPQVVNAILIDPNTGAPIRFPELIAALNALAAANAAANGLDPPTPIPTDPTYGEESTPSQTDWPGFCDWATTVCEFIDWVRAEPEPDTPPEDPWVEEPEILQQEWSSGLGGGSCPGPISFNVSIGTYSQNVEFPYTPLCEAATWIQPIAIALCGLLGVFIVGGYRRSVNA